MKSTSIANSRIFLVLAAIALLLAASVVTETQELRDSNPTWDVYFSPHAGASLAVGRALDKAKSFVLVQAYSFTSVPIADALVRAHKRGITVQVLLDRSQKTHKYSVTGLLVKAGISTKIDAAHAIAHNKIIIIDGKTVITGSFNFTKAAEERNAENLLIIRSQQLADQYVQNWQLHQRHSELHNQTDGNNQRFAFPAKHARLRN
jgi:phosphatidylserine/phosphatidylglycerophosphate/cardiolipin synthase-like enzyme